MNFHERSLRTVRGLTLVAACLCVPASCTETRVELLVDLRTDFVPGFEFISVESVLLKESVSLGPTTEQSVDTSTDGIAGFRIAEYADLEQGPYRLEVRLRDREGNVLVSRPVELKLERSFAVTVLITRDCRDVTCNTPEAQACLAGACVNAECTPETPRKCPDDECEENSDCPASSADCAESVCMDRVCLSQDLGVCHDPQYCVPESGCSPEGAVAWMRPYAGDGDGMSVSHAITVDGLGRPYVAATLSGVVDFGGGLTGSPGVETGQVLALARDGAFRWSTPIDTGVGGGGVRDVAHCAGAVYAVGRFSGDRLSIGTDGNLMRASRLGSWDAFVAKFDEEGGRPLALETFGSTMAGAKVRAHSIACLSDGTLLVTGWFETAVELTTADMSAITLQSAGDRDVFVMQLDSDGIPIWAQRFGDGRTDEGRDVALQGSRRYVVGKFADRVDFESFLLDDEGGGGGFILSLRDDWTVEAAGWAVTTMTATVDAVALDEGDGHAIAGYFKGTMNFDSGEPIEGSAAELNGFVSTVNASGERFNYHRVTTTGIPIAFEALTHSPDGSWVLVGGVPAGVDLGFGDGPAPAQSAFVLALSSTAEPQWGRYFWTSGVSAALTDVVAFENEITVVGHHSDALGWSTLEGEAALPNGGIFVTRLLN